MSETGKAAVFCDTGKPFEMREYPVPDPEPDAIVVRVTSAGICGSDLHVWRGGIRVAMMGPGPRTLGPEMTGRLPQVPTPPLPRNPAPLQRLLRGVLLHEDGRLGVQGPG